jgi:DNA-binding transcriptional ArsR family regulator
MRTPEEIPDDLLILMAEKFHMLSDPTRLTILRTLMLNGEMNVGQVVNKTSRSLANVSKHLKQLAEAGLVARRKQGLQVFYRLDDPVIEKIYHLVCDSILKELEEQWRERGKMLRGKKKD